MIIETSGQGTKGFCEVQANTPDEIYDEIRDFMFDCLQLTNVSLDVSRPDIKSFIDNNQNRLHLGTTHDECSGMTHLILYQPKENQPND